MLAERKTVLLNIFLISQVAKEHLGGLSKNPPTMIKANSTSLSDPTYLHSLLQKVAGMSKSDFDTNAITVHSNRLKC